MEPINLKKAGLVILMDALILAEMTWGVFLCSLEPESVSWTFMKTFIPLALTTIVGFRLLARRWFGSSPEAPSGMAFGDGTVR